MAQTSTHAVFNTIITWFQNWFILYLVRFANHMQQLHDFEAGVREATRCARQSRENRSLEVYVIHRTSSSCLSQEDTYTRLCPTKGHTEEDVKTHSVLTVQDMVLRLAVRG